MRTYDYTLGRLTRRELLNVAWKLGAAAVVGPVVSSRVVAQPLFRAYPFTLGVASGEPLPEGIVLWTRLAPDPLEGGGMPMSRVEVGWEIASDLSFRTIVGKGTVVARPELGHSVHVEAAGLEPGRDYWYRFHAGREVSPTGRTRTAPAEGAAVDRLRFAVCGATTTSTGSFRRFSTWPMSSSTSCSTPATTSTKTVPTAAALPAASGSTIRTRFTRWSTTATGTRSTGSIRR